MRMFRASMWAMKRSDSVDCSCSRNEDRTTALGILEALNDDAVV
jgi:hypothetical protein